MTYEKPKAYDKESFGDMSYIESFKAVMDEARILMADCDMPFLDKLQAAHDAEMKQLSKAEFHRGYESGVAARDAEQWQLDRERAKIIEAVRKVVPEGYFGSDEMLSEICRAIYIPVFGWTAEAGRYLCDRLICLLGGKSINKGAETNAKVVKNGEKYQLATYDVLGNERHKAVCELRKLRERDAEIWNIEISIALGLDLDASNDDVCDRLIYLLGGDTILREDGDGMARGDFERGTVPCDSVGARDVPEEAVVDECNFSTPESDMDAKDAGQNPAETQEESSDHVSFGIQPITSEQREYADDFCYRGHFEAFKNTAYPMPWGNPAETSEDASDHVSFGTRSVTNGTMGQSNGTCPITVQSPSTTDELRKWVRDLMPTSGTLYIVGGSTLDELMAIADRIDEQFDRICSQQEAVLQQTVDEHEREMAELRADYEQAISDITGVERGEGSDLLMPVDVFLHVRDGLRHDVEMWRDRAEDMCMERDELHKSLVKVAEHVGVPHERDLFEYGDSKITNATIFCVDALHRGMTEMDTKLNSLLDLIRDAAKDYQECQRLLRVFKCHAKDMRKERDELQDRLQAISVLCEQDDG